MNPRSTTESESKISPDEIVPTANDRGSFDLGDYRDELAAAVENHDIGSTLLLANDQVRVFEVRLRPGERSTFHVHDRTYFWTVVDGGRGLQRHADGTWVTRDYQVGQTKFLIHSPDEVRIHDLENVGSTMLRFITVELRHLSVTGS